VNWKKNVVGKDGKTVLYRQESQSSTYMLAVVQQNIFHLKKMRNGYSLSSSILTTAQW